MGDTPTPVRNARMGDETRVTLAGRIVVGTIIAVFFVVVLILCIRILARVFWWRRSSGSTRRRRFVFATGEDAVASESLRRGVDPTVMKSLPVVVFSRLKCKEGLECLVCLGEVVEGEKARILTNCRHGFHVQCIDMWLQSHSTCPLCRSPVGPLASEKLVASENITTLPLPTNVLFCGNEVRVMRSDEGISDMLEGGLVIDIPRNNLCNDFSSAMIRSADQNERRSPLSSRIRSITRLWSMNHHEPPEQQDYSQKNAMGKGRKAKMMSSMRALFVLLLAVSFIIESLTTMAEASFPPSPSSENVAELKNREKIPEKQLVSSLPKIPPSRWNPIQNK